MITILAVLGAIAALLILFARRTGEGAVARAFRFAGTQGMRLAVTLPLAAATAGFVGILVPQHLIGEWIGAGSGWTGILIASLLGGLVPGGPVVSFPMAIAVSKAGAGVPQMIAFLTAWSVFAFHRVLTFEIPLMGGTFTAVRFLASLALPPLAGGLASLFTLSAGG